MERVAILIIAISFFASCGPSEEELSRIEAERIDSIRSVMEQEKQKAEALRLHNEKIEVGKAIKAQKLSEVLRYFKDQLSAANRELSEINAFQIGRFQSEKDRQLRVQWEKIATIESRISVMEEELIKTKLYQNFDFQTTPVGVIKHLKASAKNRNFSRLPHLADPYGAFDTDVFQICYAHLTEEGQEQFTELFENARIINEYKYAPDAVGIEVACGVASNQLLTFKLVKRMDHWYLRSF